MLISDATEDTFISRIVSSLPVSSHATVRSGDDSAVFRLTGQTALSTDMLVEGQHFRREWSSGADVGWRAAVQNIADCVAVGARPYTLVVALGLPGDLDSIWLDDFAHGMSTACRQYGLGVDGGDLVKSDKIVVSVTVMGDMEGYTPVLRSGAQPGDRIVHAGALGESAAGYAILDSGISREDALTDPATADLVRAFLRPHPPLDAAVQAARGPMTALMDVSDGLIKDARRMARASGVWLDFDARQTEQNMGALARVAARLHASRREWVYTGGEDHGFVGTLPQDAEIPEGFRVIGSVRGASLGGRVTVAGRDIAGEGGWDHFHPDGQHPDIFQQYTNLFSGGPQ